ncbi:hypothetical protein [Alkaliphilus sp. B6464]|uniref:hypothetical protein n=1 Tax=Alkaliphilus sp. B6464 TaxID=2731219 RepID=UPI001BA6CE66|nr:hypothetical protein [Alkaliphilus sp. B6464]QUH18947.1 hypothetical protein HYG84_03035 [Alkaliphilus sp. B6464]
MCIKIIEGNNFYSLIKRKIQELVDETEYCGGKLKKISNTDDYRETICENIKFLHKIGLITNDEKCIIDERLIKAYG